MSAKEGGEKSSQQPQKPSRATPGQSSECSEHWFYSAGRKKTLTERQSRCPYLNQSLAKWNKQFSSCSGPGPTWLWCYLGSEGEKKSIYYVLEELFANNHSPVLQNSGEIIKLAVPMSQKSVFIPVAEFTAPAEGEFCSMRVNDEKQSPAHQLCNSPTLQTLIKCFQDLPEFPFPWG